jgi:hypothetical protein
MRLQTKSVADYHQHVMEMGDRALEARRRGDEEEAVRCFREALAQERHATELIAPDLTAERTARFCVAARRPWQWNAVNRERPSD